MPTHRLNPESLVSEQPREFDGHTYAARRNAGELRWQVFRDNALAPVGFLEAVHQPTESCRDDGWQLVVLDASNRPVGERGKRAAPGTVPAVDNFHNALGWLRARELGIA
jgi:hypothetical protein